MTADFDRAPETRGEEDRLIAAVRAAVDILRREVDLHFSLRLWNGELLPLGARPAPGLAVKIATAGVLPSLLRRPSLNRVIRHYANGRIDIEGGTIIDIGAPFATDNSAKRAFRRVDRWALLQALWPLLTARSDHPDDSRAYRGDAEGGGRSREDNVRYLRFHYDVGNDFYRLFLDPEMQYSCAYFAYWDADLETAQRAKLDLVCRKLRLKPGEQFLDIGCGWGGLLAHAAKNYGVNGVGVTLSEEQFAFAVEKMERLGLSDRVSIHLRDYRELNPSFDKIASIGMYEHIGLKNIPEYFKTVRRLLADDDVFLNHAISRGAKRKSRRFSKRPEQRALQKYIFPGGELDDIGHSVAEMERAGFEVRDVEGLREHYWRTTQLWCERLTARRSEAEMLAGAETYRIWVAYLGGCALAFQRGSARIYQTLAIKSPKGAGPLPPTREDIYRIDGS